MNIKQFFERLDTPDFIQFVFYRAYQTFEEKDDPKRYQYKPLQDRIRKINEENKNALKQFASIMIEIRNDPEFWENIVKITEDKNNENKSSQ